MTQNKASINEKEFDKAFLSILKNTPEVKAYRKAIKLFFWKQRLKAKLHINFFWYDVNIAGVFCPKAFNRGHKLIIFLRKFHKILQWMSLKEMEWSCKYTIYGKLRKQK